MISRIRKSIDERDGGFTLIELLVVMIIIGILAAIAIPVFLNQRNKAYKSAATADARAVALEVETYLSDNTPSAKVTITQVAQTFQIGTAAATGRLNPDSTLTGAIAASSGGTSTYCIKVVNKNSQTTYWKDSGLLTGSATCSDTTGV